MTLYPSVMFVNGVLDEIEFIKFLVMYLNKGMTWEYHVDSICLKVTSSIFALRKLNQNIHP